MSVITEEGNIFDIIDNDEYVAHAISADYVMGMGLAKEIDKKYDVARKLFFEHDYDDPFQNTGKALLVDNIINLTVKPQYFHKIYEKDVKKCLESLKELCETREITVLYMPQICCGRGGLNWEDVKMWIENVFAESDIEVHIILSAKNKK